MNKHKKDQSPKVPQNSKLKGQLELKPLIWTPKQQEFLDIANKKETKIMLVNGPAGSAKTILATYAALDLLNQKKVSDITYVRSAVESADSKLGYLPGDLDEKISYYGMPFLDKLEELLKKADIQLLSNENRIQVFPVNFVRGLSWNAKCIIVDEAQNLTRKELITILTRVGRFSKCFVLADPMQSDINSKSGGFLEISELFSDERSQQEGIHHFRFQNEDIMRSDLCRFLVERFSMLPSKH